MEDLAHDLARGGIFARDFRVAHKIGEGGMGVVYAAEQLSTSKTRALKLMRAALARDTRLRERFLQEARVAAQIESDHVAEVVAAGVDDATGMPWLAMELLQGEPLDQRVQSAGPLSPHELLELGVQTRHVLARAHARGLVHRDLKPENLFVQEPRYPGVPFMLKVLDFGIAKWVQETRGAASSQVMGSPLWMAPEQWQQRALIGPATDVWALALVMFYALTGRPYWRTTDSEDLSSIIMEVVSPLAPPSERARDLGIDAAIPPGFDEWFRACTARDPARRLPNADAALGAFEALFDPIVRGAPTIAFRDTGPREVPFEAAAGARSDELWRLVSAPLRAHERVQRVLTAIAKATTAALAVEPILVGLTDDCRIDRAGVLREPARRLVYEAAGASFGEAAARLGVEQPVLYAREAQLEPLRIESTVTPSVVLGPELARITPPGLTFLCAATTALGRSELRLRAMVPDVAYARRIVAAATEIARQKAAMEPRDMVTSVLREHVETDGALLACLDADGAGCTRDAIAAWMTAVDCTLARVGLVAAGTRAPAAEALAAWAVPSASAESVLADLDAWIATDDYARARAAWGSREPLVAGDE